MRALLRRGPNEVHVRSLRLDLPRTTVDGLEEVLSTAERSRARRFVAPSDRLRYEAAHELFRGVLSGYLDVKPGDVFAYRALAPRLGEDQPFYGLQPPGYDDGTVPMTRVEDLAGITVQRLVLFGSPFCTWYRPRGCDDPGRVVAAPVTPALARVRRDLGGVPRPGPLHRRLDVAGGARAGVRSICCEVGALMLTRGTA